MALKKYFAYGSNMSTARLQARVPSAHVLETAYLPGHALKFHKEGGDQSAKCNACETGNPEDILHGVVFEIDSAEKPALDRAEGLGNGYEEKTVNVYSHADGKLSEVFTYYATHIREDLLPFHWYKAFVLAGAREHDLPAGHIETIEQQGSVDDPDPDRARQNYNILNPA